MTRKKPPHRAGFVAIVGRPNVGKSTLLNRLLGEHVAAVSPRPQTTRSRVLGVVTREGWQLCLFDTPGIHRARGALNARMVDTAVATLGEVDAVLVLVEAGTGPGGRVEVGEGTRAVVEEVRRRGKPAVLGISKMDRAPRPTLLPVIDAYKDLHGWAEIVPFSGLTGENVEALEAALARHLPEGPPLFAADVLTDQAERQLAAEYVREQLMTHLREEVPYGTAVEVEEFDESARRERGGLVRVSAVVVVDRPSQKGIVIGRQGAMLKKIGTRARERLERLLGCKVFLSLHVRVEEGWTEKPQALRRLVQ